MELAVGALIFFAGLYLGGKRVESLWSSNAKTYIRMEHKGRLYKVVYADAGDKTPLWNTSPIMDGFERMER